MPGFLKVFGHPAPETPVGWNLSTERQQLITSLMTLGAFLSSGTAGFPSKILGRRFCILIACATCIVSNVIMMATTSIGALYVGRLLNGLANGYFMTFSQLYIQESSPAKYRGLFLTCFQFCTSFVSAAVSGAAFTHKSRAHSSGPSSTGLQLQSLEEMHTSFL